MSATRPEDNPWDAEIGSEVVGPAEEHIGYDGNRRGRVGFEPVGDRVAELAKGESVSNGAKEVGISGGVYFWRREKERLDGSRVG